MLSEDTIRAEPLPEDEPEEELAEEEAPARPELSAAERRRRLWIALWIVAVVLLGTGLRVHRLRVNRRAAEGAVVEQLAAMRAGEWDRAQGLASRAHRSLPVGDFRQVIQESYEQLLHSEVVSTRFRELHPGWADLVVRVRDSLGKRGTYLYSLVREDGRWRVNGVDRLYVEEGAVGGVRPEEQLPRVLPPGRRWPPTPGGPSGRPGAGPGSPFPVPNAPNPTPSEVAGPAALSGPGQPNAWAGDPEAWDRGLGGWDPTRLPGGRHPGTMLPRVEGPPPDRRARQTPAGAQPTPDRERRAPGPAGAVRPGGAGAPEEAVGPAASDAPRRSPSR